MLILPFQYIHFLLIDGSMCISQLRVSKHNPLRCSPFQKTYETILRQGAAVSWAFYFEFTEVAILLWPTADRRWVSYALL